MWSSRPKIIAECWRTSAEYAVLRDVCHARQLPVLFVNGCFDLLHSGHVRLMEYASNEVARLTLWNPTGPVVVGLNSTDSVRRLKGPGRPILHWGERAAVLAGLGVVDAVIGFDEADASDLIRDLKPKFYAKGPEYAGKKIPELEALPDGAVVVYPPATVPDLLDMSSTKIVARVIDAERTRVANLPPGNSYQAAVNSLARAGDPPTGTGGGGQPGG